VFSTGSIFHSSVSLSDQQNTNVNKLSIESWTQLRFCAEDTEKGSSAAAWVCTWLHFLL